MVHIDRRGKGPHNAVGGTCPNGSAMLRKMLVLCLVFVTAAGPWLCCCAAGQVARVAKASISLLKPAVSSENAHKCGCCRTGALHEERPAPPGPAAPDHRPCPCQENRTPLGILTHQKTELTANERATFDQPLDVLSGTPWVAGWNARSVDLLPEHGAGPPGCGRDRLSLLHILIC
jgi:hypothetical protein